MSSDTGHNSVRMPAPLSTPYIRLLRKHVPMMDEIQRVNGLRPDTLIRSTKMTMTERPAIDLRMVGIRPGDTLTLKGNATETCVVVDPAPTCQVAYRGQVMSLTGAAVKARNNTHSNGPEWWTFEGQTISDRRDEFREWHLR